jgi:hypothetical protein
VNDANPAAPAPLQDLQLQVQSLAWEVRQLRSEVALLRSLVESEGRPLGRAASASASASILLAMRNGERLNSEVRQRLATWSADESGETPTDVDLLIDRLHGLAEGPCS